MRLVLAVILALWAIAIAVRAESNDKALGAVLETTEKLVQQLGWKRQDVNVSAVFSRTARMGQALMYEFDIEFEGKILPIKLAEDTSTWRYMYDFSNQGTEKAIVGKDQWKDAELSPFKLAGPLELWIQDTKYLRLAIPNDVDAGAVQKVLLADGATVSVIGAREISLSRPFKVPLPLPSNRNGVASSIVSLAEWIRQATRSSDRQLLSLRIVRPTSLVASAPEQLEPPERLRVKKLSQGTVELSTRAGIESSSSSGDAQWLWPLPSVNISGDSLRILEQALDQLLGSSARRPGYFSLLRAKAAAASFMKVEFELEKRVTGDEDLPHGWPDWATKPSIRRFQFEVLAKVEGDKVIPFTVKPVDTFISAMTTSVDFTGGNSTDPRGPGSIFLPPVSPLTLDLTW